MLNKRLDWLDMAKGLGIISVIFAHTNIPYLFTKFIYSFHMPLFFFLSGYLFLPKELSFFSYLFKKLKTFGLPYLCFSAINYVFWLVFLSSGTNIYKPLSGTFWPVRGTELTVHNDILWFLTCLFFTELIFFVVVKLSMNNPKKIGFFLFLSSMAGYFYGLFIDKSLPWSIDLCLMALVFYGCGYLFKNHSAIFESKFLNQKTFYIFLFANILFGQINKRINMWGNDYGNYLLFFAAAFSGIMAIIIIVRTIKYKKIMSIIGKNSFIYMALHQVIALNILKFLSDTILRALNITLDQNTFIARFLLGVIFTVGSIIIIYPFVDIINKHFPFILGRSKIKSSLPINKADETELEILT